MNRIDTGLFYFFNSLADQVKVADYVYIFTAQYLAYAVVAAVSVAWFLWRRDVDEKIRILMLFVFSTACAYGLIFYVVHPIWPRVRPFESLLNVNQLIGEDGMSFPSLHTMFFFFMSTFVYFFNRKAGWWFFAAAVLIGLSRIVVGVHYPLDVAAGAIYGSFMAVLAVLTGQSVKIIREKKLQLSRSYRARKG